MLDAEDQPWSQSRPVTSTTNSGLHHGPGSGNKSVSAEKALDGPTGLLDTNSLKESLTAFFAYFNPWCWWVDEHRFREDLTAGRDASAVSVRQELRTAHYSPLLHYAILSIGVLYLDGEFTYRERVAGTFARCASELFEEEIQEGKLSGLVGTMLLGSQHAGQGRQTIGYIYIGVGLRMTRVCE